jgi:hypothetical protein
MGVAFANPGFAGRFHHGVIAILAMHCRPVSLYSPTLPATITPLTTLVLIQTIMAAIHLR